MKHSPWKTLGTVCLVFLFLAGCATEPNLYTGDTAYYGYTWQQELQLGQNADKDIVRQMGVYQDEEIAQYIREIGQKLLSRSAIKSETAPEMYRDTDFTFRVLDSPIVNAFALPGGYVYITRGLLAHVDSEAQLAVVIGHEITHVEARHASKQALKQQWGQIGLLAGTLLSERVAENKELARQMLDMGGTLFQLLTLKYGRDAERESDLHGVEYAAKSGYDASQGSAFFETLKRISEKSGQSIPSFLSSHPDPGEREQTIKRLSSQWSESQRMDIVARKQYLERIDGIVVGANPRNGYTENGYFYHPDMRFQFRMPNGWNLVNESSAVYLFNDAKSAIIAFSIAKESNALAAAQALKNRLNLQISFAQDERVNGFPSYVVEGAIIGETGSVPVYARFIEYRGTVFGFMGYGSPTGYQAYQRDIKQTTRTFDELGNQKALSIQPSRIKIVRAHRAAPFRDFLPSRLPMDMEAQDWAIINQVELDEQIQEGRLLKLPEPN